MTFGPEDEPAFHTTRDDLIRRFESWMREVQIADPEGAIASDAGLALDWTWGYGDGDLATWTADDLDRFLLDWCPRTLSAPADLVADMPINVATFIRFLDEHDLLDRSSSDPLPHLEAHAVRLVPALTEAMSDSSGFGLSRSILDALGLLDPDSGFDISEPGAVAEVMERFNSLPDEVRIAITDQAMEAMDVGGPIESIVLSPVRLPDDDTVRASALAAPCIAAFATLAGHCGEKGVKLTATGNLTLADARTLVEALGTGDRLESERGGSTHQVRSAADLPQLDRWFLWAKDAGVVRVQHGRLHATTSWAQLVRRDPVAAHAKAVGTLLDEPGILAARDHRQQYRLSNLPDLIDAGVGFLLSQVLDAREPVEFDALSADVLRVASDSGERRSWESDDVVTGYLDELLTWLEHAGVVSRVGAERTPGRYGIERRTGGVVTLTPIGLLAAVDQARAVGIEVPLVGDRRDDQAIDLVAWLADIEDLDDAVAEVAAWVEHRASSGADPVEELLAATEVAAAAEPMVLLTVLTSIAELAPEATVDRARGLLDSPIAAMALLWLVDNEHVDLDDADPDLLALGGVEMMIGLLDAGGPDELVESIRAEQTVDQQLDLVAHLWHVDHPRIAEVLDALGRHHPDPRVGTAAMQARSRRANEPGPT